VPLSMIRINNNLSIDEREVWFTFTRSPGPGGQNVNKVATKVTLHFDVADSSALSEQHRGRLRETLATRISKEGVLRIVRARHRTQTANRRDAVETFVCLLADALRPRTSRKKTQPTKASKERRLTEKARRSRQKRQRRVRYADEDEY